MADLCTLVRIPSVSWAAFDPEHVRKSAEAVAELVREIGIFDTVAVTQAGSPGADELGQPAILATRADRKSTRLNSSHWE